MLVAVMVTAAVVCTGCGKKVGVTVRGTVTLDQKPLGEGTVEFRTPDGAGLVAVARIADGTFAVPATARLWPGNYRIMISSLRKSGKKIPAESPLPPGTMTDELVEIIPSLYNARSTIEVKVDPGGNTFAFDLLQESGRETLSAPHARTGL